MTVLTSKIPSHFASLDAVEQYLEGVTLEERFDECRQRGITQKRLAGMFRLPPNFLSVVKRSGRIGHYFNFIGACKLACLYVLSLPDSVVPAQIAKK
jgi:hypothetical protein